jgi:excisionase family DNA binding protein
MTTDRPIPTVTFAEIAHLPVMVDLLTAARVLGIGRTTAYMLAREGEFPCPLVRIGGAYRVPTLGLLRLLGIDGIGHRPESPAKSMSVPLGRDRSAARA